jgi:rubrerythrin
MSEVPRIFTGHTPGRYLCEHCAESAEMERLEDARTWERKTTEDGRTYHASVGGASRLDPPLGPTIYRCPRCGHEHQGLPAPETPT